MKPSCVMTAGFHDVNTLTVAKSSYQCDVIDCGAGKGCIWLVLLGVCKLSKGQFTLVALGQAIPLLKIHLSGRLAHSPHPRHLQGCSLCVVCIHKRLKTSYRPTNELLKKNHRT